MRRGLVLAAALAALLPASARADEPTIYSSMPLAGPARAQATDVVRGERLALEQAGGRAGEHTIRFVSLNDATRRAGGWTPERASASARRAAQDPSAIAYLGHFNSGASAISIPILNEAGILQISPVNAYVGLTRESGEPGEPEKYYPTGVRTFARVSPADHRQAAAIAALLKAEGRRRVFLVDDLEVYGTVLAGMVRRELRARGVRVVGRRHLRRRNAQAIARAIRRSRADAMVYGGITQNGAVRLWTAVHRRSPRLALVGPDGVAESAFTRRLPRGAARRTLVTHQILSPVDYPPAGQAFFSAFRARFGRMPEPYAIYGYEAMSLALDAIRRGGSDRGAVVAAAFTTRDRDSVLGRYSIDANGDTTLTIYGVSRVRRGLLVYDRTIDSAR